jgi:type II secretory pathway pseudopilin PulG
MLLFELVLVLVMLALAGAVVAPRFARPEGVADTPRALAEAAASTLRAAQREAVSTGRDVALSLDLPRARLLPLRPETGAVERPTRTRLLATTAAEAARDGVPGVILFADGGSTGASLRFSEGARSCSLELNWLSGGIAGPDCGRR